MTEVILTVVGIVVGWWISHHYYKRGLKKRLSAYTHTLSNVLAGIDAEVRKELKINFRGSEITDLTDVQFIIANDGERPVRDTIEPLFIQFPKGVSILDTAILHKQPQSFKVEHRIETNPDGTVRVSFDFPLLNPSEYFLVKFFVNGDVKLKDIKCGIVADDLPRNFRPYWLPHGSMTEEKKRRVEWGGIGAGVAMLLFGASIPLIGYKLWTLQPSLFPYPWASYSFSLLNFGVGLLALVMSLILLLFGSALALGLGLSELFSSAPHFPLPKEFRRQSRVQFPIDVVELEESEK